MKTDKKTNKELHNYKRHKRIWRFVRTVARPALYHIFHYKAENAKNLPEPYIVLSNHNCDLDPALVGMSFPHQMYFVASEHVYRRGFLSKLLKWAFEPIAKLKGASDRLMVMKVIRYLREGKNICLFPDGNRSFNGKNGEITTAIGKLIKVSGANLVTYRITGGYFTNPRWGFGLRKGKMTGQVVKVYTKDQLAAMTAEEITEIIRCDTFEDAYQRQRKEHIKFKGKNRAEGMEYAVCVCPKCKKINSILTKGNGVSCSNCGKLAVYDEYGFLVNRAEGFDFDNICDWDEWQEEFYKKLTVNILSENSSDVTIFEEKDVSLKTITTEHKETEFGIGTIALYGNRFVFTPAVSEENPVTVEIPINKLPDMGIYGKTGLVFTDSDGIHYELKTDKIINVRKFVSVWKYLWLNYMEEQ